MSSEPRYIRLRWAGACAMCSRPLAAGVSAWHDKAARSVTCADCMTERVPADLHIGDLGERHTPEPDEKTVDVGVAGAGARARYEQLRAAREARARERLGGLGVVLSRLVGDPQSTAAWKTGAEGEERLAARLAKLLRGTGVEILHDRRIPMNRANIDHLAIGPGGVTVIDAKNLRGRVRIEHSGGLFRPRVAHLTVAGRDRTKLVEGVERQLGEVAAALADIGHEGVGVEGCLCFMRPEDLPFGRKLAVGAVRLVGPRGAGRLASRPGPLSEEQVAEIVARLAVRLPAAPVG